MQALAAGTYDPLRALAESGPKVPASGGYDPLRDLAEGRPLPWSRANAVSSSAPTWESDWLKHGNPVNQFVQGAFDKAITETGGAIAGGLKGLWDIATGRAQAAPGDVDRLEQETAYKPQTSAQRAGHAAAIYYSLVESCKANKVNPLTYLTYVLGNARNKAVVLPTPDEFSALNSVPAGGCAP